jgi:hypothetical protein
MRALLILVIAMVLFYGWAAKEALDAVDVTARIVAERNAQVLSQSVAAREAP